MKFIYRFRRVLGSFLAGLAMVLLVTGCSDKTEGQIFRYDVYKNPSTLDPQLASTDEDFMVAENAFEGLLRKSGGAGVEQGVAQSWEVSKDQRVYTFHLRRDAKWSDKEGTPVTAADFVFAFQRLLNPQTRAPYAENYACIANARAVLDGTISPELLGVDAPDPHTVVITLDYPNPMFLQLLTAAAASPCNEKYFTEQKGRYGVYKHTMFNGPFKVTNWDEEKFIVLRTNEGYASEKPSVAGGATLYVMDDNTQAVQRLLNGDTDLCSLTREEAQQMEERLQIQEFQDTVWNIRFNPAREKFQNTALRKSLGYALNLSELKESLPESVEIALGPVPGAVTMLESTYREAAGEGVQRPNDAQGAVSLLNQALSQLDVSKLSKTTLLVPQQANLPLLMGMVQGQWEKKLGVYINLEPLPMEELNKRVASGDYDMVLLPMRAGYDSPASILEQYTGPGFLWEEGAKSQFSGYLRSAMLAKDLQESVGDYTAAEQSIFANVPAIPVLFGTSYYGVGKEVTGLQVSPFSYRAYFKYARKPG